MGKGQMRIVLTWSKSPKDLDSYLQTPSKCKVWFRKRHCKTASSSAQLDLDNTRGQGPETITISKIVRGTYYFYVKQFSRRGSMRTSKAVVRVYRPTGAVLKFVVGKHGKLVNPSGRGRTWCVLKINGLTQQPTECRDGSRF